MFEDATFHSRGVLGNSTPKWMLLALGLNLALLATMVIMPLMHPESLPARLISRLIYVPDAQPRVVTRSQSAPAHPIAAPVSVPLKLPQISRIPRPEISEDGPPPTGDGANLSSTMSTGDVVGGSSTAPFHPTPPPVVQPATPHTISISAGVAGGLLYYQSKPPYPPIAKATGTSGAVVMAATISSTGTIENIRVLSGNPMLRQAAVDAVKTWRYHPYLLNNQPVAVETTITINFSLSGR
jgi:protein TonB